MKVYERLVIDMSTGETLEEVSHEYDGPVAECKGGGGSASGTIDFPAYMKVVHGDWLDNDGVDKISANNSVTAIIDAGVAASPYSGETAIDPDAAIAAFIAELAEFKTEVDTVDELTFWDQYALLMKATIDDDIIDNTSIGLVTTAHAAMLADRLTTEVLPRFQTGMRDINAVQSSSFVIGQAVLEAFNTRDVADEDAKLRLQSYSQRNNMIASGVQDMMTILSARLTFKDSLAKATAEMNRVKTVLEKEELAEQLDIDSHDYRWSLELYSLGANVLAAISGATTNTIKGPSTAQSVMGGAISGAAAGAAIGGKKGAGYGAAIGAIGGFLQ